MLRFDFEWQRHSTDLTKIAVLGLYANEARSGHELDALGALHATCFSVHVKRRSGQVRRGDPNHEVLPGFDLLEDFDLGVASSPAAVLDGWMPQYFLLSNNSLQPFKGTTQSS